MHIILGVFSTMILTPSLCLELSESWVAPQHYCHMFGPAATVYCHASKSLLPPPTATRSAVLPPPTETLPSHCLLCFQPYT